MKNLTEIGLKKCLAIMTALFSSLLITQSCSKSQSWAVDHVQTGSSRFDSSKLFFASSDHFNGIDIEILKTKKALRVYFSVHSQAVPPYQGDPKKALALISYEGKRHSFIVARHEGGQRFLLSDEDAEILITLLEEEVPLTIKLPGYSSQVSSKEFPAQFEKLHHHSLPNPFHLPF